MQLYATDDFIAAVDEWAKQQEGKAPNRSEAIRRLAALALDAEAKKRRGK